MRKRLRAIPWPLAAGFLLLLASCGKEPRSSDEIFRDQMTLPAVYFTDQTHTRVIAPQSKGLFVDAATGELAWPALACHNPECPGRGADGEPYLFIDPNPAMVVQPDGSVGYDPSREAELTGCCPKCLKNRDWNRLTDDERQQYVNWVRPHVLPETAARITELDAERQKLGETKAARVTSQEPN